MSQVFTAIDLSKLEAPLVVEELYADDIFAEMLADLQSRDSIFDALVVSDPAYQILKVAAYRELLLRQVMNDKAKARMMAYATGSDLDHIGATMAVPAARLDGEDDEAFRARLVLAPEAYSCAGPIDGYIFHAMSAHSNIKDVAVWNPDRGGYVNVAVLSKFGDGRCFSARVDNPLGYVEGAETIAVKDVLAALSNGQELSFENGAVFTLDADFPAGSSVLTGVLEDGDLIDGERAGILPFVVDALNADDVRPLCDTVFVMGAEIVEYEVVADLTLYYGPDAQTIQANARAAVETFVESHHACGHDITLTGLHAALHVEGVQEVHLISPAARIEVDGGQAARCTLISVGVAGRDE